MTKKLDKTTPPHRYRPGGSYARSEETQRRILEAAIQLFGERGFEGASTRDIAAAAGVNAPALQYHFDGKEGVFRACVEMLAREAHEGFEAISNRVRSALEGESSRAELIELLLDCQEARADAFVKRDWDDGRMRFLVQMQTGQAPEGMLESVGRRGLDTSVGIAIALVAGITNKPADDPLTTLRVLSLQSLLMPYLFSRRLALALLGWSDFQNERLALVKTVLRAQTRSLIDGWF
jgi:AcrR family transcriptional regulator